jgi:hypothetical protein
LEWWKVNHKEYPHIWKVAEQILAIPATSAPSERVFISAANIVEKKRVRLKPENVDVLVFLGGTQTLWTGSNIFLNTLFVFLFADFR